MIRPVFDRDLLSVLKSLLAKERREPIHIRMASLHMGDFDVAGKQFLKKIAFLRSKKNATITVLLNRKSYNNYIKAHGKIPAQLKTLEDLGVRIHKISNLHAKFVMVENNQEKCILITSANLSDTAYHKNHEVGLFIKDEREDIYDEFTKYVITLLKNKTGA